MKDWSLFGVFDGHGGQSVSRRLSNEIAKHFQHTVSERFEKGGSEVKLTASGNLTPEEVKMTLAATYARMDASLRVANSAGEFDFVGSTAIIVMVSSQ